MVAAFFSRITDDAGVVESAVAEGVNNVVDRVMIPVDEALQSHNTRWGMGRDGF